MLSRSEPRSPVFWRMPGRPPLLWETQGDQLRGLQSEVNRSCLGAARSRERGSSTDLDESWHCTAGVLASQWYRFGATLGLHRYCTGTALVLHRSYTRIVPPRCDGTQFVLHSYYLVGLARYQYKTSTVRAECQESTSTPVHQYKTRESRRKCGTGAVLSYQRSASAVSG